jgi:hypothetical protein
MSSPKIPPGYIEASSPASTRSWSAADVTHTPNPDQGAALRVDLAAAIKRAEAAEALAAALQAEAEAGVALVVARAEAAEAALVAARAEGAAAERAAIVAMLRVDLGDLENVNDAADDFVRDLIEDIEGGVHVRPRGGRMTAAARYRAACAALGLPVWRPGMLAVFGSGVSERVIGHGISDDPVSDRSSAEPDFTDAATVGCLLAAVREALCTAFPRAEHIGLHLFGDGEVHLSHDCGIGAISGETLVDALIAALEAAAARRGSQP